MAYAFHRLCELKYCNFKNKKKTGLVGMELCLVVKKIRAKFYDDKWTRRFNIHCFGHSLGSHTCAYASSNCDSIFDRVTGKHPKSKF